MILEASNPTPPSLYYAGKTKTPNFPQYYSQHKKLLSKGAFLIN
jgi:hypothetical protein